MLNFHDIRFPTGVSLRASGGPERRARVVTLASGHEQRNSLWADSRRRYDAGYGLRGLDDIHAVIAFFEARGGRLHGFRYRDGLDYKSCPPRQTPFMDDQLLGLGDGAQTDFQLIKSYGDGAGGWSRLIAKPVAGSLLVGVAGAAQIDGVDFTLDDATGVISFAAPPPSLAEVTAGFEFDTPARFDTDRLDINLAGFEAGEIPSIPLIEIRP